MGTGQSPYGGTPWAILGTIQAENYDLGGQGVAYNDTTSGNSGNAYRNDTLIFKVLLIVVVVTTSAGLPTMSGARYKTAVWFKNQTAV